MRLPVAFLALAALAGAAAHGEEMLRVAGPGGAALAARLCPAEAATGDVVIVAHGSPPRAEARPAMVPATCGSEAVQWFTARGWSVIAPLRRGYGATGGAWAETCGPCESADFREAGAAGADDLAAVVADAKARGARRAMVVGQSAGGWASIALAARNPPDVAGFVNFAGGRGGHRAGVANANCRPDRLIAATGTFGATARAPMLWICTANDSFFAPDLAAALYHAFTQAGGVAELHAAGAWGAVGHGLFLGAGGSQVWGPWWRRFSGACAEPACAAVRAPEGLAARADLEETRRG